MPLIRPWRRCVAVGAALLLAVVGAIPVGAAGPRHGTAELRPVRPAWEKPAVEDPSRLIVTFRPGASAAAKRSAIATAGTNRVADLPGTRAMAVRTGAGRAAAATAISRLRANSHVLRVSVDHHRYREADPTGEPYFHYLWGLDNTGQQIYPPDYPYPSSGSIDADIDGRQALGITIGDPNVVVAVIDDGVDFSHPDLAARAWTNPGESGAGKETNGIDDDANGYIDDLHGWDFCHNDKTVHDFDDDEHGTHVAGTIAASLDGAGVVGVAPGVSVMALKFLRKDYDPACGLDSQAIAAIAYAKSFGVLIANASWGGRGRPAEAPELYEAIATSGMLFVAAAGNDSTDNDSDEAPTLPASFDLPNIISVGATDGTGGLASFSNFGATTVDIVAPGDGILSTLPEDSSYPVGWGWMSGTSMATPHVSGSAALGASLWPSLLASPTAMKARLMSSGKPDVATAGLTVSGRLVDVYRALDVVGPVAQAATVFSFAVGSTMGSTSISTALGWHSATDDRTGVVAYGVVQRAGSRPWQTVVAATTTRTVRRTLTFGTKSTFGVRARDGATNWGAWAFAPSITPARFQETSTAVTYGGPWGRLRTASASGGVTRYATRPGASVSFRFTGRAVAVIAPKGTSRGSARLYVDGVYSSTISLYRTSLAPRIVVAARAWSASGVHTIKLVVVGTARHPRVEIDAFAVLR